MPRSLPRQRTVAIIGLGETGLPLAVAFAAAKCPTVGYDLNEERVRSVSASCSYVRGTSDDDLESASDFLTASTDAAVMTGADTFVVCVPTPLRSDGAADLT